MTPCTRIESLGVYLPEREVTTAQVVEGCRLSSALLPLERMTGTRSRRMAGETEYSLDLAKRAVAKCLAASRHDAESIDLIVAANISKQDSARRYSIEPSTASLLRASFGLHHCLAFDLNNACAGVFTAVSVVDELIRRADVNRALVVSGEYITHLVSTAQREITGLRDERLACLTLGDAGICMLVERGQGFELIDLYTVPEYARLCTAHAAQSRGAIMFTDMAQMARVAVAEGVAHYEKLVRRQAVETSPRYFIPHQTSSRTIKAAARAANQSFGQALLGPYNVVDNLRDRGNTASTSHWVALNDLIDRSAIDPGDQVVFNISASGLTVGTAQYRVGTAVTRSRNSRRLPGAPLCLDKSRALRPYYRRIPAAERVGIASAATYEHASGQELGNALLAARATQRALNACALSLSDLRLLVYCGVYREQFLSEPALATLVGQELNVKGSLAEGAEGGSRFLAFDIVNGPPGVLTACLVAGRRMLSQQGVAVVATSEYNEMPVEGQTTQGLASMGSALVLERSGGTAGFRGFYSAHHAQYSAWYHAYADTGESARARLRVDRDDRLADRLVEAVGASVVDMLRYEGITLDDITVILPPPMGPGFMGRLATFLGIERQRFAACESGQLFTAWFASGWQELCSRKIASGNLALILGVGAGGEVGCTSYVF